MNFNSLKRKIFFWIEKLQISRKERLAFTAMLILLFMLLLLNFWVQSTFNYDQERYDDIVAEFEKRSAIIEQQEKELEQKYNPSFTVSEAQIPDTEPVEEEPATDDETLPVISIVNINTATSAELQTLDGIGPTYAERIIEYRQLNNGFDSIDELINIKGIGEKRLANIRPFITLKD